MTDSLGVRAVRLISGSVHALIDQIEEKTPLSLLKQSVREVDALIDEARTELGKILANSHLAQQQQINLGRQQEQLSTAIDAACAAGKDDLARAAIGREIDIETQLSALEISLTENAQKEKVLSHRVGTLLSKRGEMEQAILDFEAANNQTERITSPLNLKSAANTSYEWFNENSLMQRLQAAQESFDRIYQKYAGLNIIDLGTDLVQSNKLRELKELVRSNKITERLNALKASRT
jgi:phage shock protein A